MANLYTTITLVGNQYQINFESTNKETGACETLALIEQIIRERIQSYDVKGRLISFSELTAKAEAIRDGYLQKGSALPKHWSFLGNEIQKFVLKIWRFCGNVDQKDWEIRDACSRVIHLFNSSSSFFSLPREVIQYFCSFLGKEELMNLAFVSKKMCANVQRELKIRKAQEFGYKGDNFKEAKNYLDNLFATVSLAIPKKYWIWQGLPFFSQIDSEKTLRRIKTYCYECWLRRKSDFLLRKHLFMFSLSPLTDSNHVKALDAIYQFIWNSSLLIDAIFLTNPSLCNSRHIVPPAGAEQLGLSNIVTLLEKGVDLGEISGSYYTRSPLRFAIEALNLELIELLIRAGADVNIPYSMGALKGMTPLLGLIFFEQFLSRHTRNVLKEQLALKVLRKLLEHSTVATINYCIISAWSSPDECSALSAAIKVMLEGEHFGKQIVEMLLSYGADPNLPNVQSALDRVSPRVKEIVDIAWKKAISSGQLAGP